MLNKNPAQDSLNLADKLLGIVLLKQCIDHSVHNSLGSHIQSYKNNLVNALANMHDKTDSIVIDNMTMLVSL